MLFRSRFGTQCIVVVLAGAVALAANAQESVRYRLLERTTLTEYDPGGGVSPMALHGTFDLVPSFVADQFLVEDFRGFGPDGVEHVTGEGTYSVWYGPAENYHQMILDVLIDGEPYHLDSGVVLQETSLPMIGIDGVQSAVGYEEPWYSLDVIAVPALPAWFSTELGFHPSAGGFVSAGDVLTTFGAVVRTNQELTAKLHLDPPAVDIGLDALHVEEFDGPPWWECWFSAEADAFSLDLGWLYHGDFLSEGGFVVARNWELLQNFWPEPPADIDYGLDAITWPWVVYGPDWYFSTEDDFETPAGFVQHGDLLSSFHGTIVFGNQALLANFDILPPVQPDYGLDAVFRWPSGHIWFSVEDGFEDARYGPISDGDLLSTEGWVIYRNLEMVRRFDPLEDLDNFGLDAVQIWPVRRGDMNGDTRINAFDIDPFVLALVDREGYYALYPELDPDVVGDINYDGVLNAFDIDPFVALLIGGG